MTHGRITRKAAPRPPGVCASALKGGRAAPSRRAGGETRRAGGNAVPDPTSQRAHQGAGRFTRNRLRGNRQAQREGQAKRQGATEQQDRSTPPPRRATPPAPAPPNQTLDRTPGHCPGNALLERRASRHMLPAPRPGAGQLGRYARVRTSRACSATQQPPKVTP
jgi:hypothetical protein